MSIPNNSFKKYLSIIARFDPIENSWTRFGNLQVARNGHGVIQVGNEFIVVGGTSVKVTESCKLNGESITCTTRTPTLWSFQFYPELILLP